MMAGIRLRPIMGRKRIPAIRRTNRLARVGAAAIHARAAANAYANPTLPAIGKGKDRGSFSRLESCIPLCHRRRESIMISPGKPVLVR